MLFPRRGNIIEVDGGEMKRSQVQRFHWPQWTMERSLVISAGLRSFTAARRAIDREG